MLTKNCEVQIKADGDTGDFVALASVFGNVDLVGDRMMEGAFSKTLERWREKGDPIPIVTSHQWDDPWHHIGVADPGDVMETSDGLQVSGKLDIQDNPLAKQVHRLMKRRSLTGWSFGYTVPKGGEERGKDGVNDVSEVDLVEVGPTLKGANPEAQLQYAKSLLAAHDVDDWAAKHIVDETHRHENGDTPDEELEDEALKAVWSGAFINNLPDSSFLYIEPGGTKDGDGKTTPRSLRHFPYKDASGSVDMPHLRNALSRIPQSNLPQAIKDRLTAKAQRILDGANAASEEIQLTEADVVGESELRRRSDDAALESALGRSADDPPPESQPDPKPAEPRWPQDEFKLWAPDYIEGLPDSAFLYIDEDGARHFAVRDEGGELDAKRVLEVAREVNESDLTREVQDRCRSICREMLSYLASKSVKPADLRRKTDSVALETALGDRSEPEPQERWPQDEIPDVKELPDDAFLYIEPSGVRHFPVRDAEGELLGAKRVRQAIREIDESALPDQVKDRCRATSKQLLDDIASADQRSASEAEGIQDTGQEPAEGHAKVHDPLRRQTESVALESALGRSPRSAPPEAEPEPAKPEPEPPDERELRRAVEKTALEMALGGQIGGTE